MKENKDPQAAIYIDEEYFYKVELGVVPDIAWEKGTGALKIEIPYDGAVIDQEAAHVDYYPIGKIQINRPDLDDVQMVPVGLKTGGAWEKQIKSNKKHVSYATYKIEEPDDPLISVDGVVLDDEDPQGAEGIFGKVDVFSNPLALQLSLWVPDLLAETRPSEVYELETMLLRGENTRQVFLPQTNFPNFEQDLAEDLVALANTAGGAILIGVNKNGHISGISSDLEAKQYLYTILLKAALRCDPPVPIWRVAEIQHPSGKMILRIEVPVADTAIYRLNGMLIKRQGSTNITQAQEKETAVSLPPPSPVTESNLIDIFDKDEMGSISFGNRNDVVVLNGENGLKSLRLGSFICGLINAEKSSGRIIITNLPTNSQNQRGLFRNTEDIEKILSKEMEKLLPHFSTPTVEPRHLGNQKIAIIHLPTWQMPISLYDGQAFNWQNPALIEIKSEDLFEKYNKLTSRRGQSFDDQEAYLELASLNRAVRPPEVVEQKNSIEEVEGLSYDDEYQAQVCQPRPFKRDEDTVGYSLQLTAPLRHISLAFTADGKVSPMSPEANGNIRVRLNDVLVSDLEVIPQANEANLWLNAIPIIKRTYLNITYKAHLNEMFERRTKTSRMRFLVPGVLLDRERVNDLAHICADVGFRVFDDEMKETAPTAPTQATISGIRSHDYYDISLRVGLMCHSSELTRELHYDGWRDSKSTTTAVLDVRIKLWGTGRNVQTEIGKLQMELYKTISRRLQHLRAE